LEAILGTLQLLGKNIEKEENQEANDEISKDLTHLLLKLFKTSDINDNQ
jgi:hypothetical protein